jgi:hypothetical protein
MFPRRGKSNYVHYPMHRTVNTLAEVLLISSNLGFLHKGGSFVLLVGL